MAVDSFTNGVVLALTGMRVPAASGDDVRVAVAEPHEALSRSLAELQRLIADVTKSVAGSSEGHWSEAYVEAMRTFASGEQADYIENLRLSAKRLAKFA
ncbi:hypothetical protein ABZV75_10415, partial [Streptomyces flaveolus]|uniref:hypothetical protein n=1 Tax=Streptomyces flaveolus TaxID=67297 RepID=UPI0033A0A5BA